MASTPASASRCFCPPERAVVEWSSGRSRPTAASAAGTRRRISSGSTPRFSQTEGHVVAEAGQHGLGVGILQHESRGAAHLGGRGAVDEQLAALLALVRAAEDAGEPVQQGRLAGAGRAQQQHPLPRLDDEVETAHGPVAAAGVPPAPAARLDPCAAAHLVCHRLPGIRARR